MTSGLRWLQLGMVLGLVAAAVRAAPPLVQLSPTVYHTEHVLFVIDSSVTWSTPSTAYSDIYGFSGDAQHPFPRLEAAFNTLVTNFPGTYFSVCYLAKTGANNAPNYIDNIYKAAGINEPGTPGAPQSFLTVDICRYNLSGNVLPSALGVFDHEFGHAWGAQVFNFTPPTLSNGHWLPNSTVDCQMSATATDDGGVTVSKLYGDPTSGFRWQRVDNLRSNDRELYSEQTLYLMGLREKWPTAYVLNNPVYQADGTATASSVDTFDHAALVAGYGARNPDYTTSQKHFKIGFVYIARDVAEVNSVYQAMEQSANHFSNAEVVDLQTYRFQVPFLVASHYRASVDSRLADLDGNATPTLTVTTPYVTSTDGTATISFVAADPDGPAPTVTTSPAIPYPISGNTVQISGLPDGVHFFTLKAQDAGGKKAFDHFVVEVHRPAAGVSITTQPVGQTVTAGVTTTFNVAAAGPGTLTYRWYHQFTGDSFWGIMVNGGNYSGVTTPTLSVTPYPSESGEQFICVVTNGTGTATSDPATLTVNETVPVIATQPVDRVIAAGNTTNFSVSAQAPTLTFGYSRYQWQRLSAGVPGATWTNLSSGGGIIGGTAPAIGVTTNLAMNGDQFRCVVTNTTGTTVSNVALLTVGTAPAITAQPSPVTVNAGQDAVFTVGATGTAPLAYQWKRYGVDVPGGTGATLTIASAQVADAGAYTVTITNAFGTAGSNVGSLTVNGPAITTHPATQTVTIGTNVYFDVAANGAGPLTYAWQVLRVGAGSWTNLTDGTDYAGTSTSELQAKNTYLTVANTGEQYRALVTDSAGITSTSNAATLTVLPYPPSVYPQPVDQIVAVGTPLTLTAGAVSNGPVTYQWRQNGNNVGTNSATYTVASAQLGDAGSYTVVVTNAAGSATSNAATVTVLPGGGGVALAAALNHSLLIRADGSLWGMGYGAMFGSVNGAIHSPTFIATGVADVAAGRDHTVFLKGDGTAWILGAPFGVGIAPVYSTPFQIGSGVAAISAGLDSSYFIKTDGSLWAMGRNTAGQLGDGTTVDRASPVQVATGVQAVTGGNARLLYIKSDGTLWAAGANDMGQLGDGTFTDRLAPVQVASSVRSVYAGNTGWLSAFIKQDGTLWVMGAGLPSWPGPNNYPRPTPEQIASNVVSASLGDGHLLFVKSDGTLWAMGGNGTGVLGDGTFNSQRFPIQVATGVVTAKAGTFHSIFTKADGSAWSMGRDQFGQLGNGPASSADQPAAGQIASGAIPLPGSSTLTATLTGGVTRLNWTLVLGASSYEIWRNTVNNSGTATRIADNLTAALYTDNQAAPGAAFCYWVRAVNGSGAGAFSPVATGTLPLITSAPTSRFLPAGSTLQLQVTTASPVPVTYQWRHDGVDLTDGGRISGATTATLVITSLQAADAGSYQVVITNVAGSVASSATVTVSAPGERIMIWRNQVTGNVGFWLMNGPTARAYLDIGPVPLDWQIAGTGDFNHDGQIDLLWRNQVTGSVGFWLMNGSVAQTYLDIGPIPLDWQIAGTGDFNHDGNTDIIWRNQVTGNVGFWLMNGTSAQSYIDVGPIPLDWQIAGTGDFNHDGNTDLLWRHRVGGNLGFWMMNGTTAQSYIDVGYIPLDWQVAGTADIDNDGNTDIIWRQTVTGNVGYWFMNGTAAQSYLDVGPIPLDWQIMR